MIDLVHRVLAVLTIGTGIALPLTAQAQQDAEVRRIGDRLELFVDAYLVDDLDGVEFKLHPLQPTQPSSQPALSGHYATILRDGDGYKQYARAQKIPGVDWKSGWERGFANEVTLMAVSDDGTHWTQPDLGLFDYPERFPEGNVVLADPEHISDTHNFTPFIDLGPGAAADEKYKAVGGHGYPAENWGGWSRGGSRRELLEKYGPSGLYGYVSPDGIHWRRVSEQPIIADGDFDSQNVAFWSEAEGQYVCYYRVIHDGRTVARRTSPDFLHWSEPVLIKGRQAGEQWYTNGTHPYFRAPHIYIAPATRFLPNQDPNTRVIFMTTRPGSDTYDRIFGQQDFLPDPSVGNRTNYIAWTNGAPTGQRELSFYNLGARYTVRLDGFGSLHAGPEGGQMLSKQLVFEGNRLVLNFETRTASPQGSVRVELLDSRSQPIPGYTLDDAQPLTGDAIDGVVSWQGGADLSELAGKPIRLRLVLNDADVYSLRFRNTH